MSNSNMLMKLMIEGVMVGTHKYMLIAIRANALQHAVIVTKYLVKFNNCFKT